MNVAVSPRNLEQHEDQGLIDLRPPKRIEVGDHIVQFVQDRVSNGISFGHSVGIGTTRDGVILGGVAFYSWNYANIFMHVASDYKDWVSREGIKVVFDYAFNTCKVKRVTGLVTSDNKAAIDFDMRLGFKLESVMKDASPTGDMLVLVMFREDCRWIK